MLKTNKNSRKTGRDIFLKQEKDQEFDCQEFRGLKSSLKKTATLHKNKLKKKKTARKLNSKKSPNLSVKKKVKKKVNIENYLNQQIKEEIYSKRVRDESRVLKA